MRRAVCPAKCRDSQLRPLPSVQAGDAIPVAFAARLRPLVPTPASRLCGSLGGNVIHAASAFLWSDSPMLRDRDGRRRHRPPTCFPRHPGMRNSARPSCRAQKACNTDSTSPQTWDRTRTCSCCNARSSGSESAAQRSTSIPSSASERARSSGGSGSRTHSRRRTSRPRRRVTSSTRVAVSSNGETRSCKMGTPIVTPGPQGRERANCVAARECRRRTPNCL